MQKKVLKDLQQFVDGKVSEANALGILVEPKSELYNCLFDERENRNNLEDSIPNNPRLEQANRSVYALEDAFSDLQSVVQHLKDSDADYQGLIDVYIKSAIEHIKKAIAK